MFYDHFQKVGRILACPESTSKNQNFDFGMKKIFFRKTECATRFPMVENLYNREIIKKEAKLDFFYTVKVCDFWIPEIQNPEAKKSEKIIFGI